MSPLHVLGLVLLVAAIAIAGGGSALAEEPPPTPEAVAERVVAAWSAKDTAAIRALAAEDEPDPWLVADALLVVGARAEAEAFAGAGSRKDVERLRELVSGWKPTEGDARARAAIAAANAALLERRYGDALAALDAAMGEATAVPRVRVRFGRGLALDGLERHAESADAFGQAVAECERVGWWARAAKALGLRVGAEVRAKRGDAALDAARRLVELERARGPARVAVARAHGYVAYVLETMGRLEEAAEAHRTEVAVLRTLPDAEALAASINDLAAFELRRRDSERAIATALESLAVSEPKGLWREVARSRYAIARAHTAEGRLDLVIESLGAALAAAEKAGDVAVTAGVLYDLAAAHVRRRGVGDLERAFALFERAAVAFEAAGDRLGVARSTTNVADGHRRLGRLEEAKAHATRAVALSREIGAGWVEGTAHAILAEVAETEQKHDDARRAFETASALFESAGDRIESARASAGAAEAQRAVGDLDSARATADRALEQAEALGDAGLLAYVLRTAARVRRDQGLLEAALPLARRSLEAYRGMEHAEGVADLEALVADLEARAPR